MQQRGRSDSALPPVLLSQTVSPSPPVCGDAQSHPAVRSPRVVVVPRSSPCVPFSVTEVCLLIVSSALPLLACILQQLQKAWHVTEPFSLFQVTQVWNSWSKGWRYHRSVTSRSEIYVITILDSSFIPVLKITQLLHQEVKYMWLQFWIHHSYQF